MDQPAAQRENIVTMINATASEKLNTVLDQVLQYANENENFLKTTGIFREAGEPLAVMKALMLISKDPLMSPLKSLPDDFLKNPHNVSSIYKYFVKNIKDKFSENDSINAIISNFQDKILKYTSLSTEDKETISFLDFIHQLIASNALFESKFLHNHLHLCYKIAQNQNDNKMNQDVAVLVLCDLGFQDYVFGVLPVETQLMVNLNLQKIIAHNLKIKGDTEFQKNFNEKYPELVEKIQSVVQVASPEPESKPELETEVTEDSALLDEASTTKKKAFPFVEHQEKLKGMFKDIKSMATKTITDFTKKPTAPAAGVVPVAPKAPIDYKKQAMEVWLKTKKITKEMVALTLDKDIPIEFTDDKVEDVISYDDFSVKISAIYSHLNECMKAIEENNKQEIASKRLICKNDQKEIDVLILDLEKEFRLIFKGLQSGESLEALSVKLGEITDNKWRPLAKIREIDQEGIISAGDDFDIKFERLLSLHAGIHQALQSMSQQDESTTDGV
ncbi:hypothetical protein CC99x_009000 [Candidatus Berkiella cookevillensis]|uniref:Rho-GAP domain-containing protein n=1 Tax=Candidatus Berkiella cookevillensis TaxID=437022 RepID=A0A0Q9YLP6_9GAMM|nr:hypothetical protein [Candidatus Berkiella cookevillensis]MCS5709039.1 hypothetical protein [Candidatus Berkiella cookevillensis]